MFQLSTDTETPAEVCRKEIKELFTAIGKVPPQEILDSISERQASAYHQRTSEHPVGEQSFIATIDGEKKRIAFKDMAYRTKFGDGGTRFVYVVTSVQNLKWDVPRHLVLAALKVSLDLCGGDYGKFVEFCKNFLHLTVQAPVQTKIIELWKRHHKSLGNPFDKMEPDSVGIVAKAIEQAVGGAKVMEQATESDLAGYNVWSKDRERKNNEKQRKKKAKKKEDIKNQSKKLKEKLMDSFLSQVGKATQGATETEQAANQEANKTARAVARSSGKNNAAFKSSLMDKVGEWTSTMADNVNHDDDDDTSSNSE